MSAPPRREAAAGTPRPAAGRPRIAFFDYPDVFEDFYPHYGVDQRSFATRFADTANHAILRLVQREVGDVTWYSFSIAPRLREAVHEVVGCRVAFRRSPSLHRALWRAYYGPHSTWRRRWPGAWKVYGPVASYASLLSWRFLRELAAERPDFVFTQDYSTGRFDVLAAAAHVLGIPLVAYHSGSRPDWYHGRLVKRATLRSARCLLVSSREEARQLATQFGVDPARIALFLGAVDTELYRPLARELACRDAGLDPARRHLLFAGRLDDRVKRVGALIQAFAEVAARHPDADLVIAGDGPDRGALARAAAGRLPEGRVRFTGWVGDAQVRARLYNAADCLVLPSRSEGFPAVVGEAAACGTPALASRVGGVAEVVEEGVTGWLVEPGDDRALRERLERALEHPGELAAMRPAARRRAEERLAPGVAAGILRGCFAAQPERTEGACS